jgi:hypothetical protein
MVQVAKITLSEQEKRLMCNSDWILAKRSITTKVILLLNNILVDFKQIVEENKHHLPAEIYTSSPKIAKGESYLCLPYVTLDYPKFFNKKDVFAMRSMFWWGNFFSCTLHLSGKYKERFQKNIIQNINKKVVDDLYCCVSEDEWQHHFEKDNYNKLSGFTKSGLALLLKKQPFIKIAFKFDLQTWDNLPKLFPKKFAELLMLIV